MFDNVVVGVNEDEDGRDGIALAKQLVSAEGQLAIAHVEVAGWKPAPDSGAVGAAAKRRRALDWLALLRGEAGLKGPVLWIEERSAARGLRAIALDRSADLLVIGASRRDELLRVEAGDDTRAMLEFAPCAVAVAPVGYSARGASLRTVGVAYDGSPASERALAAARAFADEHDARLSAFEAVAEPLYVRDAWSPEAETAARVEVARRRIAGLGNVEAHAGSGDPVEQLAAYERTVDLLVLGAHSYGLRDRLLQSTTAQRVADSVACPILVAGPEG
jgi:nucleotide-binding universal stress UspA family protein